MDEAKRHWEARAVALVGPLGLPKSDVCEYDLRRAVAERFAGAVGGSGADRVVAKLDVNSVAVLFPEAEDKSSNILTAVTFANAGEKMKVLSHLKSHVRGASTSSFTLSTSDLPHALFALSQYGALCMQRCVRDEDSANTSCGIRSNQASSQWPASEVVWGRTGKQWSRVLAQCRAQGGAALVRFLEDWQDEDCEIVGGAASGWTAESVWTKLNVGANGDPKFMENPCSDGATTRSSSPSPPSTPSSASADNCFNFQDLIGDPQMQDDFEEAENLSEAPQSLLDSGWSMLDLTTGMEVDF